MKVLLVGEYNRSHRFLKEGLKKLNHEATVVGLADGFKKVDVDIKIKTLFDKGLLKKIKVLIWLVSKIDLHSIYVKNQIRRKKDRLKGYDVIQLINESPFLCQPRTEKKIFNLIKKWNNSNIYLLSCGTDYISVKYAFDKNFKYSILTPMFEGKISKKNHSMGLKYLEPEFEKLHKYIYKHIVGVISCDLDYTIPLKNKKKHLGLIPHLINTDKIEYSPIIIRHKIIIFHGINSKNYYKKGNDIFERALKIIKEKFSDKVDIITVENLPYKDYINAFSSSHILLDQVYAYDQGYNALEAMAKGKVVFTGAEQEWLEYYNLVEDTIAVNALPNEKAIAKKLEFLILNPNKILEISKNARKFVEKEHHYVKNTERFLKIWQR